MIDESIQDEDLPLVAQRRIDRRCLAFEDEWLAGKAPVIEQFVGEIPGEEEEVLFRELLLIELVYRRKAGQQPRPEEYEARFPTHSKAIAETFRAGAARTPRDTGVRPAGNIPDVSATADFPGDVLGPQTTGETPAPRRIAHFELLEFLGEGGFGAVWRAHDTRLDRIVALKIPRRGQLNGVDCEQFLREARIAAGMHHPGVVEVYDVKREGDLVYIVSEYIDGPSLAARLKAGPLSPAEATRVMIAVAKAVAHIHKKGFVHRDLKPQNILLDTQGRPHVADFGLALHESVQRQLTGDCSGTLAYMSPEQTEGKAQWLDGRADLWALGVIFYEMLTGQRPFHGECRSDLVAEIQQREPKPPRAINKQVPIELERICLKCLAKPAGERYAIADDLVADLRRWSRPRRRPWAAILGGLAVLSVVFLALYFAVFDRKTSPIPLPLTGTVDLTLWNTVDPARRGISVREPGAAPLRPHDYVRVSARLNRPAYIYLIWIDSEGKAVPLYPWTPGDWTALPAEQSPAQDVDLPPTADEGWPIQGPGGRETLLLLARERPLPRTVDLPALLAGLPHQPTGDQRIVAWFDNGRVVSKESDAVRGLDVSGQGRIDDTMLRTQRLLQERLGPHFPLVRAISVPSKRE